MNKWSSRFVKGNPFLISCFEEETQCRLKTELIQIYKENVNYVKVKNVNLIHESGMKWVLMCQSA